MECSRDGCRMLAVFEVENQYVTCPVHLAAITGFIMEDTGRGVVDVERLYGDGEAALINGLARAAVRVDA